jgi:insertion element IS1 protein InsB
MVDRLLLEKLPLAGIARAVQVSETWLQEYVNAKYQQVEKRVNVPVKKGP